MFSADETKIISLLKQQDGLTLSELAQKTKLNKSSLFYQLQGLIKSGVLRLERQSTKLVRYHLQSRERLTEIVQQQILQLDELLLEPPALKFSAKPRLVFCDDYVLPEPMLRKLDQRYDVTFFPDSPPFLTQEEFLLRCKDAEILVIFYAIRLTRELLQQCKHLKAIVSATLTEEYIDKAACADLRIKVFSLDPERNYKKAARIEFVFTSLFALLRPIHQTYSDIKLGRFDYTGFTAHELKGKRVALVGTKREGAFTAPLLHAFGTDLLIVNPDNPKADTHDLGVSLFVTLEQAFAESDIIIFPEEYSPSIHIDELLANKRVPQNLLFLTSTVKYSIELLRELLLQQKIKGIFIDYFADEFKIFDKFPQSEYRKIMNFPNVLITPEIGFYTVEAMQRNAEQVFEILNSLPT